MTNILKRFSLLFLLFAFAIYQIFAQNNTSTITRIDSTKVDTSESVVIKRKHSPKVATYLSTVVPGAGQIFNGKYWKVPLIYAGFAVGYYLNRSFNSSYITYKNLYNIQQDSVTVNPTKFQYITYKGNKFEPAAIQEARNRMRKNRDLTTICLSVWYVLNIVDACVDAYLFDYDMSDNLSVNIKPSLFYLNKENYSAGIALRFYVKK